MRAVKLFRTQVSKFHLQCSQQSDQLGLHTYLRRGWFRTTSSQHTGSTNKSSTTTTTAATTTNGVQTRKSTIFDSLNPFMVEKTKYLGMSISELCGHTAFICATAAYVNTDILALRSLVMGGISLSIVFQYYRPAPLWIPIKWNFLLLAINAAMISSLLAERNKANRMPKEWEQIYKDGEFQERGFSRVEFNKLMEMGHPVELKKGTKVAESGKPNKSLYLLTRGKVSIQNRGSQIATVNPYHFIGEMTFLSYDVNCPSATVAVADAIIAKDGAQLWEWDLRKLKLKLRNERQVSNALSAYINHDLRDKLIRSSNSHS